MTAQLTRTLPQSLRGPDERRFLRWAGWSGIAATTAFLLSVVVANLGGPEQPAGPGDVLDYLAEIASSPTQNHVYGIAGIVFCVVYIPMLVGVHRTLGATVTSWFGTAAMVAGMVLLVPAYAISVMEPSLAGTAAELGTAAGDAAYAVYGTLAGASTVSFTAGSILTLSIGPLLWSFDALRSGAVARWLAWVGVVTGVSGLVWFVWFSESGAVLAVLIVNVVGSLVYFYGLSGHLIRTARPSDLPSTHTAV